MSPYFYYMRLHQELATILTVQMPRGMYIVPPVVMRSIFVLWPQKFYVFRIILTVITDHSPKRYQLVNI